MKYFIGNTDYRWFNYLSKIQPEVVNFWKPLGSTNFNTIVPYAPYLFRLKSPINAIGGVGFFSGFTHLPISLAWDAFGERNGFRHFQEFKEAIQAYRTQNKLQFEKDPIIGCIVLTAPCFFSPEDWIIQPENWSKSIVQGKGYDSGEVIGGRIWKEVSEKLLKYSSAKGEEQMNDEAVINNPMSPDFAFALQKIRLGQGAFRIEVMNKYNRRCSISGEKTLPVLEAAHIKDHSESGPHHISNGLFLRSDLHKLFDRGYITLTTDHRVEVSNKIREEYENGKDYYQYKGRKLVTLPEREFERPSKIFIEWHQENRYKG